MSGGKATGYGTNYIHTHVCIMHQHSLHVVRNMHQECKLEEGPTARKHYLHYRASLNRWPYLELLWLHCVGGNKLKQKGELLIRPKLWYSACFNSWQLLLVFSFPFMQSPAKGAPPTPLLLFPLPMTLMASSSNPIPATGQWRGATNDLQWLHAWVNTCACS